MKVYLNPAFEGEDRGDGGIRRVVEAQRKYLPSHGIEVVETERQADVVAVHAGIEVRTNKPTVAHVHGLYWAEYEWPMWAKRVNKDVLANMKKAAFVTVPSKWVARTLQRSLWIDPIVIPHGVDSDAWSPPEQHSDYVLWNKTRPDSICDPQPVSELARLASDVRFVSTYIDGPVPANISVTGTLPFNEAAEHVRKAGVYLCTSRETFGIGTLEAMACGVPILGFRWGGQTDIVEHGITGYLATPGDYADLKRGLDYCRSNRDSLGCAAREVAKTYAWDAIIQRYADLYQSALAVHKGPKVSIVVPTYNMEQYLPDTLESIKAQDYDDYEIIVVDDASTDNSAAIAKKAGVRVVSHEKNRYLSAALNTGIANAKGEYILPLDADNMLGSKNALRTLANALDNDPLLDIAYGSMSVIEEDGKEWTSSWPPTDFEFRLQMLHKNQISSTAMYRKKIWEISGGYRRRCRTAEDADFWCRVTSLGAQPKKVTNAVVLRYRNRKDSMSHTNKDWDWTAWYPWARDLSLLPLGQGGEPYTYEPVHVSVIIPVGPNHTELLVDAIDSVVAQTFQKWEIIVANDSRRALPPLPSFVKVIDTNGIGVAAARNAAIRKSIGTVFVPLDADDYLQPYALEKMYAAYQRTGSYVYSDWIEAETGIAHSTNEYNCRDILRHLPHAVTAMYSRSMFDSVGGFDEALIGWEDWDFVIALASKGFCGVRVPEALFTYRYTTGQRREELYAQRDELKHEIGTKWSRYIYEGEELMACGCNKKAVLPAPRIETALDEGMVLLEFTKDTGGTVTYLGKVTGTAYRFGAKARTKYVYAEDAKHFLQREEFRQFRVPEKVAVT